MQKIINFFQYIVDFFKFIVNLFIKIFDVIVSVIAFITKAFVSLPNTIQIFLIATIAICIVYKIISLGGSGE